MVTRWLVVGVMLAGVVLASLAVARAEHKPKFPPGPIRDRNELMEQIGKNAKTIGDAIKAGQLGPVEGAAETIHADAAKITGLFPPGSTDPKSRAKPEIWTNWAKFAASAKDLQSTAAALAAAAKSGADVPGAAKTMFGACKSCHDDFRVPEKKK